MNYVDLYKSVLDTATGQSTVGLKQLQRHLGSLPLILLVVVVQSNECQAG